MPSKMFARIDDRTRIRVVQGRDRGTGTSAEPVGRTSRQVSLADELMHSDLRMEVESRCASAARVGNGPTRGTAPCPHVDHEGSGMCISGQHRLVHSV